MKKGSEDIRSLAVRNVLAGKYSICPLKNVIRSVRMLSWVFEVSPFPLEVCTMSLGRQKARQESFWVARQEMPKSPGNPFYEKLNALLRKAGFDAFVEDLCAPFYAKKLGRPSIPPGRYFRMLLLGYFEGIDSERGICWRCEDSLSVREFVGLEPTDSAPEHSSMTRIRQRLPLETHHAVFEHLHKLLAKHKLFSGKFLGIDSSTMEANASLKAISPVKNSFLRQKQALTP